MDSDFPEFDHAYKTILVKDADDKFEALAANANFIIYHSDIWRGTARRFAESIVRECIDICDAYGMPDGTSPAAQIISLAIKHKFGVKD